MTGKTLTGETIHKRIQLNVAKDASANHVVHRYLNMYLQNQRQGSANTKTRSEVRGGGKKAYAQKGTGNARRGTTRSPLIPGGGILFGPKHRDWSISMTKKEKRLGMATALQNSAEIMTLTDNFHSVEITKTKTLVSMLQNLGVNPMEYKVLLISKDSNRSLQQAGKNVQMLTISNLSSLNIFDVLNADKIILEEDALTSINAFYGP